MRLRSSQRGILHWVLTGLPFVLHSPCPHTRWLPISMLLETSKMNTMKPRETQKNPGPDLAGLHNQRVRTDMSELCKIKMRISEGRRSLLKEKEMYKKQRNKNPDSFSILNQVSAQQMRCINQSWIRLHIYQKDSESQCLRAKIHKWQLMGKI